MIKVLFLLDKREWRVYDVRHMESQFHTQLLALPRWPDELVGVPDNLIWTMYVYSCDVAVLTAKEAATLFDRVRRRNRG